MTRLERKLERNLLAYAAAASAAGVGMLALAQPSQAEIVFTSKQFFVNENPSLDINNDGITDFKFTGHHSMHRTATSHQRMSYGLLSVHGVESGNQPVGGSYASALKAGYVIGPSAKFSGAQRMLRSKDKDGNKLLPLRVRSMAHRPLQDCESLSGSKVPDQWRNSFRMGSHERAHYVGSFHQSASHGLRVRNRGRKTDCRRPKTEREPGWGSVESVAVGARQFRCHTWCAGNWGVRT